MKKLATIALSISSCCVQLLAADVCSVLTPWMSPEQARQVQSDQLQLILRHAPDGTRLKFYDGWNLKVIAEMVPSGPYRERKLRGDIGQLLLWFRSAGQLTGPLTNTGAIRTPAVLDELGRSATPRSQIVLLGSTIYRDPQEPQFSFFQRTEEGTNDYWFPGDGLLNLARSQSPFGVAGKAAHLQNVSVHFLYPDEAEFPDGLFKEDTRRFYSLLVSLQSGRFVSFSSDRRTVLENLFKPDLPAFEYALNPALGAEMLRQSRATRSRGIPVVSPPPPRVRPSAAIAPRTENEVVRQFEQQSSAQGGFSAGIFWQETGVDADFYVITARGQRPLYFGSTNSPAGYFERDYRDANHDVGWEAVHLKTEPSSEMQIYVNLYSTAQPLAHPFTGKFMVRHNGQTKIATFQIAARTGNAGQNFEAGNDPHWTCLDWKSLTSKAVTATK